MSNAWRNYDSWRTSNPADEAAAEYEARREKLAEFRRCSVDDISDADLDDWLADEYDRELADREDHYDAMRERDA
jgi:hypothetical protein